MTYLSEGTGREGVDEPEGAGSVSQFLVTRYSKMGEASLKCMRAFLEASNLESKPPSPNPFYARYIQYLSTEPCASARLSDRSS